MMCGYFAWVSAAQICLHMPHSHIFTRECWSSSGVYETVIVWNWARIITRSNAHDDVKTATTQTRSNTSVCSQTHLCLGVFMVKQSCSTELQRTPVHEINAEVRSAILILTDSDCLHGAVTWEEARQTLTGRKFHPNVDLWPALSACRDTTRHVSQSSSLAACCTATRVCWGKGKQAHNCTCNLVWSCDKFQAIKKVAEEPKISKITNNNNNKKIRVLMAGFSFVLLC